MLPRDGVWVIEASNGTVRAPEVDDYYGTCDSNTGQQLKKFTIGILGNGRCPRRSLEFADFRRRFGGSPASNRLFSK